MERGYWEADIHTAGQKILRISGAQSFILTAV
jgi:hypothetical protein